MEKIRIGIVGVRRGWTFFNLFEKSFEETEVTAICENDEKYLEEEFKAKSGVRPETKIFTDYEEMLDSGLVDAVMLANFFHEHAIFARMAMERGIAVLSETTAAPSLGECVDLVETQERTGTKYMLAANCLYIRGVHAMKKYYEDGKLGRLLSGNAEYWHGGEPNPNEVIDENNVHWRKFLPSCHYNMHTLGPLMYITNSVPVKVSCKAIYNPEYCAERNKYTDSTSSMVVSEMSNGAVFNTTGCNGNLPTTKWYRLAFENGALETPKYTDMSEIIVAENHLEQLSTTRQTWVSSGVVSAEEYEDGKAEGTGHGGVDYFVAYYFIKYLKGEFEPFFNVYRSVALSANGILAWFSALTDGKEYTIPDFSKKEDRDKVRGDYRMPFAKCYADLTVPCRLDKKDEFTGYDL